MQGDNSPPTPRRGDFAVNSTFSSNNGEHPYPSPLGKMDGAVFSTAYLPPVSYFMAILQSDTILIEAHENYVKQSYRNRCRIATANGIETLSIPIQSNSGEKTPIRDVQISDHGNWQQNHWRAIHSAYKNSPFFEFLEDDFYPFFHKNKWKFLWDYNLELLTLVLNLLDIQKEVIFTDNFIDDDLNINDLRNEIHPKKKSIFTSEPYYQVFENKFGFLSDLSIIDLIFNMGNEVIYSLSPSLSKRMGK